MSSLPFNRQEAGSQAYALKFLTWLRVRGYELPGDDADWFLVKPILDGGRTRRSRYDKEEGILAWYLCYFGDDKEALHWSNTFGGEVAASTLINRLDQVELTEVMGYSPFHSYRRFAGMCLSFKEEFLAKKPPKMKTVYIFKCDCCGFRMEDPRKNFGEKYVHSQCGQESTYELVDTIKVEVAREN